MTARNPITLAGLDGTNPLGFLAALGALVTARTGGEPAARLGWARTRTWTPVLHGLCGPDSTTLSDVLAAALRGREVSAEGEQRRAEAEEVFTKARTAATKKLKEVKRQGLKGCGRGQAIETHVRPLERDRDGKRKEWLQALRSAVPRPELALGARIDCTDEEYREHAGVFLADVDHSSREPLDLLAAFGSDACLERDGKVAPTPFCFIRGGGHQDFLDTVRQLIAKVTTERVAQAILAPWTYRDPKLSMRWDPVEDKRYALTDRKPADEGASTVWMANLLAYRGLALFPCAPTRRGLGTTGWQHLDFTWPTWEFPASPDTIRSLLQLRELGEPRPDHSVLRARGVSAVFRASRIRFPPTGSSYKWNFSPARPV